VVCLEGSENVGDVGALVRAYPGTTFLFLTDASPPRSSLAHAVRSCGGEIMSKQKAAVVIAVTLIALLAQTSGVTD
jgi:hypothetical protein